MPIAFDLMVIVNRIARLDAVALLVEALRCKPKGHGFDSRWCHWNFSGRTLALGSAHPLREMSTRNILWGVRAAGD
jgi:hypothetical protein